MLTASAAAVFLAGCWYRPWLAAAPIAVLAAIVLADRLTARQPPPRALRFCAAAAILVALAAVGWYARWWAVAISIPLAGVVCLNASFYRYFLRHRGWLFTAAVLPMQILYYLYSGMALVAGTLQHWRDTRRGRRTSRILDQRRPDAPAAS